MCLFRQDQRLQRRSEVLYVDPVFAETAFKPALAQPLLLQTLSRLWRWPRRNSDGLAWASYACISSFWCYNDHHLHSSVHCLLPVCILNKQCWWHICKIHNHSTVRPNFLAQGMVGEFDLTARSGLTMSKLICKVNSIARVDLESGTNMLIIAPSHCKLDHEKFFELEQGGANFCCCNEKPQN